MKTSISTLTTLGLSAAALLFSISSAQATVIPSGDSWLVACRDTKYIETNFTGTYAQALAEGQTFCAKHGGVGTIFNNGLTPYGFKPVFFKAPKDIRAIVGMELVYDTAGGLVGEPEQYVIPTTRSSWRIQCQDNTIIDPFLGSYAQALGQCSAQGGVKAAFDNGLIAYGYAASFKKIPKGVLRVKDDWAKGMDVRAAVVWFDATRTSK